MLEAIWSGLIQTLSWPSVGLMLLAVPIGMFFGAVPGLGGKLGLALLIPFVFGMSPAAGFAFLLGMHSTVHTGGSLSSIMFGTPGTGADAATILDGYPLAKQGQAARAMGASLGASGVGGVIGAVIMAALIPIARQLVLSFSPSEFFMMAVFGITLISMVSGNSLLKGLITGAIGLAFATVGLDPQTGLNRFGFGQLWLWDGLDLITIVIGVFGLAEMIELGIRGGSIASKSSEVAAGGYDLTGVLAGIGDVFEHWWLTLRCSVIGCFVGVVPGLGGDAASWICYGHAAQTSKHPETFGKGNIEGVIAPESANNSKEGGALIPTIAFGIPGSSGMAILLGAFIILGVAPGPSMLIEHLDTVWAMVWILALSNIVAVLMFLVATGLVARLTYVRAGLIVPFVLVFIMYGAYLSMARWQYLPLAIGMGLLGYAMKKYGYPPGPLMIGLVLGPIAENNLSKSLQLWGPAFLLRPLTLMFGLLTLLSILYPVWQWWRKQCVAREVAL